MGNLGEKIKAKRIQLGLSQHGLAFKAGISSGLIYRIEAGRINPSLPILEKIVESLEEKLSNFISEGFPFDQKSLKATLTRLDNLALLEFIKLASDILFKKIHSKGKKIKKGLAKVKKKGKHLGAKKGEQRRKGKYKKRDPHLIAELKKLRLIHKLSYRQIAKKLGISAATVSRLLKKYPHIKSKKINAVEYAIMNSP
jgi:transcriptional regulator with XRE-family HTH domain